MFVGCNRCGTTTAGIFVSPDYQVQDHVNYIEDSYSIVLLDEQDSYEVFSGILSRKFCEANRLLPGKFRVNLFDDAWKESCLLECQICFTQRTFAEIQRRQS